MSGAAEILVPSGIWLFQKRNAAKMIAFGKLDLEYRIYLDFSTASFSNHSSTAVCNAIR